jgi:hypothetical protein
MHNNTTSIPTGMTVHGDGGRSSRNQGAANSTPNQIRPVRFISFHTYAVSREIVLTLTP